MSSLSIPKDLLASQGIDYDSLPVLPKQKLGQTVLKICGNVALAVFKMTIIGAIALFAIKNLAEVFLRLNLKPEKLTSLGQQLLQEREIKIRSIARKAGFADYQKIKLGVIECGSPAAAIGKATLSTSPEYLVKPEDLPEELKLSRLDDNELTEEEWVVMFNEWVRTDIMVEKNKDPKSQLELDVSIVYGKAFLNLLRDQNEYKKGYKSVVGHELGHCFNRHSLKTSLADLGWDLLALPTLGISTLFQDKVLEPLHRKHEIEADLYSQDKFGSDGLVSFFTQYSECGKVLHEKYPHKYDDKGGNKSDHQHPHLGERILYLKLLDIGEEYLDVKNIGKRIKDVFARR